MAIIRPAEIDRLISRAGDPYRVFLIYGPDEGLVRLRQKGLAEAFLRADNDPLARIEFEAEALNADPPRLMDEAQAIGMFGNRRVIMVRQAGRLSKAIWQNLLENPPTDALILLAADDLAKGHALRNASESNPVVGTIACYPLSDSELRAVIERRCREAGLSIAAPARDMLADLLGADQGLSDQEIDKLILFCAGKNSIEISDIEEIIADSSAGSGTEPIDLAFDGDLPAIELAMHRSLREGISASAVINMAISHVQMLRRLQSHRSDGNLEGALKQERVFFKRQDRVRRQVDRWPGPALGRALETLSAAQMHGRMTPSLEETIAVRALWAVALAARRR